MTDQTGEKTPKPGPSYWDRTREARKRGELGHGEPWPAPFGGDKVRENLLRRMAARQGLALMKSRRRDPRAVDFGTYMLVDPDTNAVVAAGSDGHGYGLTLDDIEEWLTK